MGSHHNTATIISDPPIVSSDPTKGVGSSKQQDDHEVGIRQ